MLISSWTITSDFKIKSTSDLENIFLKILFPVPIYCKKNSSCTENIKTKHREWEEENEAPKNHLFVKNMP